MDVDGIFLEFIEEVIIDVDEEFFGFVIEKLMSWKVDLLEMMVFGGNKVWLVFYVLVCVFIGYYGEFLMDIWGIGIINCVYYIYVFYKGWFEGWRNGVFILMNDGSVVFYVFWNLEEWGVLFIDGGLLVY